MTAMKRSVKRTAMPNRMSWYISRNGANVHTPPTRTLSSNAWIIGQTKKSPR